MNKSEKMTRRKLLRRLGAILSIPISILWIKGIDRTFEVSAKIKIMIPKELAEGITFLDKIIINKNGGYIRVFSSSCSHLGCKIKSEIDNKLICPCHGSKFDYEGKPIVGPAVKQLERIELQRDKKTGEVIVYV